MHYLRSMVTEIEVRMTARLRLRRPVMDDVKSIVAIDSDPRTNLHRPGGAPSPDKNVQTFSELFADGKSTMSVTG